MKPIFKTLSWLWLCLALGWTQEKPAESSRGVSAPIDSTAQESERQQVAPPSETGLEEQELAPLEPSAHLMIPVEGDVFYEGGIKVIASLEGPRPAGLAVLLDGYPVDAPVDITEDLLEVEIARMSSGVHYITLIFFNENTEIVFRRENRFFVRLPEPKREPSKGPVRQYGRLAAKMDVKAGEAGGRIRSLSEVSLPAAEGGALRAGEKYKPLSNRFDGALEGSYNVKFKSTDAFAKARVRTDESPFRQPAHRVTGGFKYGPWLSLRAGDLYPLYNGLILNNMRVRGVESTMNLASGESRWGSLKLIGGESRRKIPAHVALYETNQGDHLDTLPGTFAQELLAARMGFGGGRKFDFGITVMRATDMVGSVREMAMNDSLRGIRPVDNLVAGSDLCIGLWAGKLQFYGDQAFSLYTKDVSLGAYSADSFDIAFQPVAFDRLFIFNATTRGWEYLIEKRDGSGETDVAGFVSANSAYTAGVSLSLPLPGWVTETEIRYSHLGLEYHSEGNPFLGSNPGNGITALQKFVLLDNRLSLGLEVGNYLQDLGIAKQIQRTLKSEVRFTPGPYHPSFWFAVGGTKTDPESNFFYRMRSEFAHLNAGGYHQFNLQEGKLHTSLLYGFTQSSLTLEADTLQAGNSELQVFPDTRTNIVTTNLQYKPRYSSFVPRLSHSLTHNGIQKPLNSVTMGGIQSFGNNRVTLDASVTVGQYPENNEVNDLSIGESIYLSFSPASGHALRLREKWTQYGNRRDILAGMHYEFFF